MSHKKLIWPGGQTRYSIDRENMRICIIYNCKHLSLGTCKKDKCVLVRRIPTGVKGLKH